MSYLLYTGQTIEALVLSKHPRAAEFEKRLFDLNDEAARLLAAHLEVETVPDTDRHIFDASFAAVFRPAFEGQAMPEVLEGYDTTEEWGE